ncbi:MAG: hypothetical protein IJO08_03085 [Clostridia bacterium]|nr:hypothetical protein [Clostridia bacterium]
MRNDVQEMLSWNYQKAMTTYDEFLRNMGNARGEALADDFMSYLQVVANRRYSQVRDYTKFPREGEKYVAEIIQSSKHGTLIIVDGESGTGKSTFAKKLCQKEDFFLFDLDEYAAKLLTEYLFSGDAGMIFFDQKQDELLRQHTERIIKEGSNNGQKTTVMVACFRNVVYRTIIAHTLGKYFEKVISIVIHDNLAANIARIKMRECGQTNEAMYLAQLTFNDMEDLKKSIAAYGIGYDESCWINHAAVHNFK